MSAINFEFCRLCLRRKRASTSTRIVDSLRARVLWIFQIKLFEAEGLPTQMCNTCMDRLSIAQQLKETILSVDTSLRLRGSNFHEQDLSTSMDDGVIPLHAVKMEEDIALEDSKKKRGRKRKKKEPSDSASSSELEAYGLQFANQLTNSVKKEPGISDEDPEQSSDFLMKEVDIDEINHNESFSFHSVLEIKEEHQDSSDNENEYSSQVDLDPEYVGHVENGSEFREGTIPRPILAAYPTVHMEDSSEEYPLHPDANALYTSTVVAFEGPHSSAETNYLPGEAELVIDEGPDLDDDTESLLPVPVLTLNGGQMAPLRTLLNQQSFGQENPVPVEVAVFRGKEGDLTVPLTVPMSSFENVDLSCSSGTSGQQEGDEENVLCVAQGQDVEEVLPEAQVFKTLRRKLAKKLNSDPEMGRDSQNGSISTEEDTSDGRVGVGGQASRIAPAKERHRCERCKRWYVNFIKLSQHRCRARPLKTKKTINYVKCSLCEDVFYKLSDLNEHVRSHRHVESHHCALCDRRFTNKTGLTKHMSLCHKQEAWASQVGIAELTPQGERDEAVVILEEDNQSESCSERSILKALLAGQRIPKVT